MHANMIGLQISLYAIRVSLKHAVSVNRTSLARKMAMHAGMGHPLPQFPPETHFKVAYLKDLSDVLGDMFSCPGCDVLSFFETYEADLDWLDLGTAVAGKIKLGLPEVRFCIPGVSHSRSGCIFDHEGTHYVPADPKYGTPQHHAMIYCNNKSGRYYGQRVIVVERYVVPMRISAAVYCNPGSLERKYEVNVVNKTTLQLARCETEVHVDSTIELVLDTIKTYFTRRFKYELYSRHYRNEGAPLTGNVCRRPIAHIVAPV